MALSFRKIVMVAIVVTLESHPEKEAQLITALEKLAAGSRTEAGCLKWEWSQKLGTPTEFALYELYTDLDAIDAHKASQHFADWKVDSEGLLAWKKAGKYDVTGRDDRPV